MQTAEVGRLPDRAARGIQLSAAFCIPSLYQYDLYMMCHLRHAHCLAGFRSHCVSLEIPKCEPQRARMRTLNRSDRSQAQAGVCGKSCAARIDQFVPHCGTPSLSVKVCMHHSLHNCRMV